MKWYRQLAWQANNNVADEFQLKFRIESIAACYKVIMRLLLQRHPIVTRVVSNYFFSLSRCITFVFFLIMQRDTRARKTHHVKSSILSGTRDNARDAYRSLAIAGRTYRHVRQTVVSVFPPLELVIRDCS